MKKLSDIYESIWSDMQDRGTGESIKKEDIVGNIKVLKPIDMGGSILWADTDLELNDENRVFTYNEAEILVTKISELPDKSLSEWRLPTLDETDEIRKLILCKHYTYDDEKIIISSSKNELLSFMKLDKYGYQSWAIDNQNCPCMNFEIDENLHPGIIYLTTIMTGKNSRKSCIRLVKNK